MTLRSPPLGTRDMRDNPSLSGDLDLRPDLGQPVEYEISCGTHGFLQPAALVRAHITISLEEPGVCFLNEVSYNLGLYGPVCHATSEHAIRKNRIIWIKVTRI